MPEAPMIYFIGGFLGAGKTTAIRSLADFYGNQGLRIGVITNDQAEGLVDTLYLTGKGIDTREIAGSCFCCNFDGLAQAVGHLISTASPDIILAEPVGSCTDIVATVVRPMKALMADRIRVGPFSVLVEPDRWKQLSAESAPWSMRYLFDKQLKEADIIVLTKIDDLSIETKNHISDQLAQVYPDSRIVKISSLIGEGIPEWIEHLRNVQSQDRWLRELDYSVYAQAEAEMGWLNAKVGFTFSIPRDGSDFGALMCTRFRSELAESESHIGHLKLMVVGKTGSAKIGLTNLTGPLGLEGAFSGPTANFEVTVNIRAVVSPAELVSILLRVVGSFHDKDELEADISSIHTFRPAPPKPVHRLNA